MTKEEIKTILPHREPMLLVEELDREGDFALGKYQVEGALCGDLGCSGGPTFAGMMASCFGDNLKIGMLCAIVFPAVLSLIVLIFDFIMPKLKTNRK